MGFVVGSTFIVWSLVVIIAFEAERDRHKQFDDTAQEIQEKEH